MSRDLLNPDWEGGHFYRHDLESLFYIILCLASRYTEPGVPAAEPRPHSDWFSGSDQQVFNSKSSFLSEPPYNGLPIQPYFAKFSSWLYGIYRSTSDGYKARPPPTPLIDDDTDPLLSSNDTPKNTKPDFDWPGGPFAYQTRLLERTSSSSNGSLSRTNSQSGNNILTNNTGFSVSSATRRWTPGHRVANSLDAVRGKWEERARENTIDESPSISHTPTRLTSFAKLQNAVDSSSVPSPSSPLERTPTYLKRFTTSSVPSSIIATPLSPNSTGVTVEADPPSPTLARQRIHLPSHDHVSRSAGVIRPISPPSLPQETSPPRRNTVDFSSFKRINPSRNDSTTSVPSTPSTSSSFDPSSSIISTPTSVHRRPTSLYSRPSVSSDRDKLHHQSTGSTSSYPIPSPTSATSVTAPSPSSLPRTPCFQPHIEALICRTNPTSGDNEDPVEEKKKQKEIEKGASSQKSGETCDAL
ncbi:hypothetical protein J3R30DRAFT_3710545 [Lentinula aciculospora]|uniref:Fungal-type protein kinase domain-containing protein n=1 Tax=Lentinula aciculospora TaxID=153920 RepID=A0A9W9A0P6_9AGAR|nr:hypothetical protein J3R30DRAFT_3710545 [Lentinula aciculospora]